MTITHKKINKSSNNHRKIKKRHVKLYKTTKHPIKSSIALTRRSTFRRKYPKFDLSFLKITKDDPKPIDATTIKTKSYAHVMIISMFLLLILSVFSHYCNFNLLQKKILTTISRMSIAF